MRRDAKVIADRFSLTRRQTLMLGSAGLAALALGLSARQARAVGNVTLGDAEVTIVSDGTLTLPLSFIAPDVPAAELEALLKANGLATDAITPDCNVTFFRSHFGGVGSMKRWLGSLPRPLPFPDQSTSSGTSPRSSHNLSSRTSISSIVCTLLRCVNPGLVLNTATSSNRKSYVKPLSVSFTDRNLAVKSLTIIF